MSKLILVGVFVGVLMIAILVWAMSGSSETDRSGTASEISRQRSDKELPEIKHANGARSATTVTSVIAAAAPVAGSAVPGVPQPSGETGLEWLRRQSDWDQRTTWNLWFPEVKTIEELESVRKKRVEEMESRDRYYDQSAKIFLPISGEVSFTVSITIPTSSISQVGVLTKRHSAKTDFIYGISAYGSPIPGSGSLKERIPVTWEIGGRSWKWEPSKLMQLAKSKNAVELTNHSQSERIDSLISADLWWMSLVAAGSLEEPNALRAFRFFYPAPSDGILVHLGHRSSTMVWQVMPTSRSGIPYDDLLQRDLLEEFIISNTESKNPEGEPNAYSLSMTKFRHVIADDPVLKQPIHITYTFHLPPKPWYP